MNTTQIKAELAKLPEDQARELLYKFVVVDMVMNDEYSLPNILEGTLQEVGDAEDQINDREENKGEE